MQAQGCGKAAGNAASPEVNFPLQVAPPALGFPFAATEHAAFVSRLASQVSISERRHPRTTRRRAWVETAQHALFDQGRYPEREQNSGQWQRKEEARIAVTDGPDNTPEKKGRYQLQKDAKL